MGEKNQDQKYQDKEIERIAKEVKEIHAKFDKFLNNHYRHLEMDVTSMQGKMDNLKQQIKTVKTSLDKYQNRLPNSLVILLTVLASVASSLVVWAVTK